MPISDSMKNMMLQHTHAAALAEQAKREGIATLREDGLDKVRQGLTTLAEVEQATHD
jgi:type IV pilus assembly protein PilB